MKKLKGELKEIDVVDKKLVKTLEFIKNLNKLKISQNIFVNGGSALREGLVVWCNHFYLNFKYTILHESIHYVNHKKKMPINLMETEATVGGLILYQLPQCIWKKTIKNYYSKFLSTSIFKEDIDLLNNKKFKVAKASVDNLLELKYKVNNFKSKQEYIEASRSLRNLIPSKIPKVETKIPTRIANVDTIYFYYRFCRPSNVKEEIILS